MVNESLYELNGRFKHLSLFLLIGRFTHPGPRHGGGRNFYEPLVLG
jgi:hypothetical protein